MLISCSESVDFQKNTQSIEGSEQATGTEEPIVNNETPVDPADDGEGGNPPVIQFFQPTLQLNKGAIYTNNHNVEVDLAVANVTEMYITNDPTCAQGGEWVAYAQESDWALVQLNQEAAVYGKVKYINGAISRCVSDSIIHDSIPPTIEYNEMPTPIANYNNGAFAFTISDNLSGVAASTCQLDNDLVMDCTTNYAANELTEGNHSLNIRAVDRAGNAAANPYPWMIDTIAPVVTLTDVPDPMTMDTDELITFNVVEDGSGLQEVICYLDNSIVPCPILGTINLQALTLGPHNIRVVATDNANNSGEDSYAWTVEAPPLCQPETYQQADFTREALDILFVVDSSYSLDTEREAIANAIDLFVRELPENTDFQIGLIFGHATTSHTGRLFRSNGSEPRVISSDLTTEEVSDLLLAKFARTPQDNPMDGGEAMLYSLHAMLNGNRFADAQNEGFFREDAALSVVFVTDENDICARFPDGVVPVRDNEDKELPAFANYCVEPEVSAETVYQELLDLQAGRPLLVAGIYYSDVDNVPSGGENEFGYGISDIVELNGGLSANLGAPSGIDDGLAAIGQLSRQKLELETEFAITQVPEDLSQIQVYVDGALVPHEFIAPNTVRIAFDDAGTAESEIVISSCPEDDDESSVAAL